MSTIEDNKPRIYKGLAGVVVDTTAISKVVPETNSLTYRGYAVQDLAAHCSFEQVAYLLWHGELPNDQQLALFTQRERASRRLQPIHAVALGETARHLPPDGCGAHVDQLHGGRRPRRGRQQPEGQLTPSRCDVRGSAHHRRRRHPPPARAWSPCPA